ncbi:MAG: ATP-binding cassette domain-containing protein [Mariprofundaceae bacterium]
MPVLSLNLVSKAFGPQELLSEVKLTINRGARIGLIGRNGEGKSTLLRIMAGLTEADSGSVTLRRGARVAYLPQEPQFEEGQTVFAAVARGLGDVAAMLESYDQAVMELEQDASDSTLKHIATLQAELERHGAWQYKVRIETAMSRLSLEAHQDVGELSGGWQRRTALAAVVVAEPDVLLLDEPTNHLDMASIEWLEDFIADYAGAVMFVTHDRYFLDAVAEEIVELDRGSLRSYPCSYSDYLLKKAEQLQLESRQSRKFDQLLAGEDRWIRQGIPARRRRDEGRVRRLEGLRHQRSERRMHGGEINLRVAQGVKPGKMLIEAIGLNHAYGPRIIARNIELKIMAGERVGLIGPNGVGKTTLLRLLLGMMKADGGRVRHGARLVPAFLAQMRDIDPKLTLKEVLLPQGGNYVYVAGIHARHVASYLEDFLFDGEKLRARVSSLSGGERGRLLLARLLLEPANLLVLDEPTNDLDIGTLAVLEQALAKYDGTILLVSHDRAFMDRVVTRVLAFEGDGKIVAIEGGYSDYAVWKQKQSTSLAGQARKPQKAADRPRRQAEKLGYKEQRQLDALPETIEQLESEKARIEARFCDPDYFQQNADSFQADQQRLTELAKELEAAYTRWEALESKSTALSE